MISSPTSTLVEVVTVALGVPFKLTENEEVPAKALVCQSSLLSSFIRILSISVPAEITVPLVNPAPRSRVTGISFVVKALFALTSSTASSLESTLRKFGLSVVPAFTFTLILLSAPRSIAVPAL